MKPSMLVKKPRPKNNGRKPMSSSHSHNPNKEGGFQGGYEGQENRQERPRHNGHSGNRGNYQQLFDKYTNMARESLTAGDRVAAEFHYQHADHYLRLQNERNQQEREQQRQAARNNPKQYPIDVQNVEIQPQPENSGTNPTEAVLAQ